MSAEIIQFRTMAELPNRIRELRKARGLTLEKVAAEVGCSKVQLRDLELGERRLHTHWMEKIAKALSVSEAELLRADQNPFSLSPDELRWVERYRNASPAERETLQRVTDAVSPYRVAPPSEEQAA